MCLFSPKALSWAWSTVHFYGLIQMLFWCLAGLRIVLGDVAFIEHRLPCEVSGHDFLDARWLDWIATHCVHRFDWFFCYGQVVDAVGLLERILWFLACFTQLQLSLCLHQQDAIATALITFADENWLAFACDQNICLFVHLHLFISEDGDVAIIGRLSNAHQWWRERFKRVCLWCRFVKLWKR